MCLLKLEAKQTKEKNKKMNFHEKLNRTQSAHKYSRTSIQFIPTLIVEIYTTKLDVDCAFIMIIEFARVSSLFFYLSISFGCVFSFFIFCFCFIRRLHSNLINILTILPKWVVMLLLIFFLSSLDCLISCNIVSYTLISYAVVHSIS